MRMNPWQPCHSLRACSLNGEKTTSGGPEIWAYRDARAFVRDRCAWKRAHEREFSYRKLARLADPASPGYIQGFAAGRRNLRPETARRVGKALGLDIDEAEFFVHMTTWTQAPDGPERETAWQALTSAAVRRGRGRLSGARLRYLMHPYIPVVQAMASLIGFRPDPVWIAPRTVPLIRIDEARHALAVLRELGVLVFDDKGGWSIREPVLETAPDAQGQWMREYHRAMLQLSERALDLLDRDDRRAVGFTVTVPRDRLPEPLAASEAMMRELFDPILAWQEDLDAVDGDVVQCSLQVFRLSRTAEMGKA